MHWWIFLLSTLLVTVRSTSTQQSSYITVVGQRFAEQWNIENVSHKDVTLIKDNKKLDYNNGGRNYVTINSEEIFLTFVIDPLLIVDEGNYTIALTDDDNFYIIEFEILVKIMSTTEVIQTASLSLINRLKFNYKPHKQQNVTEGCDLKLVIPYSGRPESISLINDNDIKVKILENQKGSIELLFNNVTTGGLYKLTIENENYLDSCEFEIVINNFSNNDPLANVACPKPYSNNLTKTSKEHDEVALYGRKKAGIITAVVLGVLFLIAFTVVIVLKYRKNNHTHTGVHVDLEQNNYIEDSESSSSITYSVIKFNYVPSSVTV